MRPSEDTAGKGGGATVTLLFDGECGLCSRTGRWVLRHDVEGRVRLVPLASAEGADWLHQLAQAAPDGARVPDSVILIAGDRVHFQSDAVVELLALLPGWRRTGRLLGRVPRPLRELGYRLVARLRRRRKDRIRVSSCNTDEGQADAEEENPDSPGMSNAHMQEHER
jgi:predicted DCC family thiol-disulfide oxidoreductase YuxK